MRIFVTGASGWIGSAVIPELLGVGHQVVGLARSEESAAALTAAGADTIRGTIDDLEVLSAASAESDGVIHLAFKHDLAFTGDFEAAAEADGLAITTIGDALAATNKPFSIASGLLGLKPGEVSTELDGRDPGALSHFSGGPSKRFANSLAVLALSDRGVRSSVVRLSPTVHGDGDTGFVATLVNIARERGVAGFIGDGSTRWPAVHVLDAANLFRLAIEQAPAGSVLHGAADQGVSTRQIAEVIGRHLGVPTASVDPADAPAHFTWLAHFLGTDSPASNVATRELLGWDPTHPGLIEDLEMGRYFAA